MRSAKLQNIRQGLSRLRFIDWLAAAGMLAALFMMAREADRRWGTPATIAGFGEAIDGDSILIGGKQVRLKGVDAPEIRQYCQNRVGRDYPCGLEAKRWLRARLARGALFCRIEGHDRYGRMLGVCHQGHDLLNTDIVREGHAVAFGAHESEENAARQARAGLWQGRFMTPSEWRALNPRTD